MEPCSLLSDTRRLAVTRPLPIRCPFRALISTPTQAVGAFAYAILSAEPSFAAQLTEPQLLSVAELSAAGLRDDAHWATCRGVLLVAGATCAALALVRLADPAAANAAPDGELKPETVTTDGRRRAPAR